jgi:hypothetical protein
MINRKLNALILYKILVFTPPNKHADNEDSN